MKRYDIVELGRLLADPTRVALLDAMFDGRSYTVTELSRHARVAVSTASEHLGKLLDAGLVSTRPQGRHRYYRLAGTDVAGLLETLFQFEPGIAPHRRTVPADLAFARTCYDHLAGTVGVGLADHLIDTGAFQRDDSTIRITAAGERLVARVDLPPPTSRRNRLRPCLDWSERRDHLAGTLPSALLAHLLDKAWLLRRPNSRALELTATGRAGLKATFGYEAP